MMKCIKCGYDYSNSGDSAHVCGGYSLQKQVTRSNELVQIGRLTRKMNKLKDQRDKARAELIHYRYVMRQMPYLRNRFDEYMTWKKEQETMLEMKKRIKEQSLLIEKLTGTAS